MLFLTKIKLQTSIVKQEERLLAIASSTHHGNPKQINFWVSNVKVCEPAEKIMIQALHVLPKLVGHQYPR